MQMVLISTDVDGTITRMKVDFSSPLVPKPVKDMFTDIHIKQITVEMPDQRTEISYRRIK